LPSPIYVDGCAYSVGDPRPIESLLREGVLSPEAYEDCVGRGITTYCAGGRSIVEMSAAAIATAIASAGLAADAIDCVVSADAAPDVPVELGHARVMLQAPDCAALCAGIEAAAQQIAAGTAKNVLLLVAGHVPTGTNRYNPGLGTVFGDGAAACIVSTRRRGFAVIAAENWVGNTPAPVSPTTGEQMLQDFQRLQNLLKLSYEAAMIAPAAVTALCGTHGSQIYLELMAEAADLPYERVYDAAMHEFGHVFACDNLIALAHFLARRGTGRSRVFCLVGWSPHAAGVVLLEEVS
jgi:3-Oxoacyl-[acyl-carrier-protein (ACP)] synthase III